MIGYAIKSKEGYLTSYGEWSQKGTNLLILPQLDRTTKLAKKYKGAVVVEIKGFTEGRTVYRGT